MIGNDVVDLADAGEPSARFVSRVLAPEERRIVDGSGAARSRAVWRLWTAKEAAYKALARSDPELPFRHARFVVDVEAGVVSYDGRRVPVGWDERGNALSCVARGEEPVVTAIATLDEVPVAAGPPAERPSRAALGLARRLLGAWLDAEPPELEVVRPFRGRGRRPGPPEVWRTGARLDEIELSLAHDGDYVACAVSRRR